MNMNNNIVTKALEYYDGYRDNYKKYFSKIKYI